MALTYLLALAVCAPCVALLLGRARPALAGWAAVISTVLVFGGLVWTWVVGTTALQIPWAPAWGATLHLELDGLAFPFCLLTVGLGALVLLYGSRYIPNHLSEHGRPRAEAVRFHAWILAFIAAMLVLATAQDLLVLFVALDLTGLASFFLIAFDRDEEAARSAAVTALVLTVGTSLLFLAGAALIAARAGGWSVGAARAYAASGANCTLPAVLIAVALLAKSAQVPLHFWLPRAMVAPTPVSAYLHSAALVAAGVFVLERLHFLFTGGAARDLLWVVGSVSLVVGSLLALTEDRLKSILAGSTVAQYGYVVLLLAMGGDVGTAGAAVYVLVHGVSKSGLFMTAGAVHASVGEDRLSRLGGLFRQMPVLALSALALTATLAGLPPTAGFFKDEVFFESAHAHGPWMMIFVVVGASLTLAYGGRFWWEIFLGAERTVRPRRPPIRLPLRLVLPVALLAALALVGGFWSAPLAAAGTASGSVIRATGMRLPLAWRFQLGAANVQAVVAWALGALSMATRRLWTAALARGVKAVSRVVGPAALYDRLLRLLDRLSDRIHAWEARDLRERAAAVLVPMGVLVVVGFIFERGGAWRVEPLSAGDGPLVLALAAAAGMALFTARSTTHPSMVVMLSCSGFALAVVFALSGAPDVALVSVLVETTLTLLLLALLSRLPTGVLRRVEAREAGMRRRHLALAVLAGIVASGVAFRALSRRAENPVGQVLVSKTPAAHGKDVVTVILADFRGLDTVGEAAVIAVALLGISTLAREVRA